MDSAGLTFSWTPPRWFCPRLSATLGVSVLVHLLIFFLFLVLGPEHLTSPPPAPEISLLSPDVPEHQALLESLRSESPIAALAHQLLPSTHLAKLPFRRSFQNQKSAPLSNQQNFLPPTFPLIKLPETSRDQSLPPESPAPLFTGKLELDAELSSRIPANLSIPTTPVSQLLEPSRFRIALREDGKVAFLILEKSSGNEEADRKAELIIKNLTFGQSTNQRLQWGKAALLWASRSEP